MSFSRKQFTFYRSFYHSLDALPPRTRDKLCWNLIRYALDAIEPQLSDKASIAVFESIRPVLDKARSKAISGKNGGEASGEVRSKCEAKPKQKRSKNEAEGEIEEEVELEVEYEGEVEKEAFACPHGESNEIFPEVFDTLRRREVFMEAKDKAECKALCAEYGTRAIIQAIERAWDQHAPRWAYIRAIVTSGGVGGGKKDKGGYQKHGDVPSPGMIEAARQMLEEDV